MVPFRSQPPRQLSLYSQAIILCSGIYAIMGWIFFGFGMVFFWVFTWNSTCMNWFNSSKNWEKHNGIVKKVEATNASENEEQIYKVYYIYNISGTEYGGKSYYTDSDYGKDDEIIIEYNEKLPEQSRGVGGRTRLFGWWAIFAAIFPLIGLGMIYLSLRENQKALHLIKNGVFTTGEMLSKEPTGSSVEINGTDYPIYKFEFEFEWQGQKYISACKTYKTEGIEDEEKEFILYQPSNPTYNAVYDGIPNAPTFNHHGQIENIPIQKSYFLIAPVLSLLVHVPLGWLMVFS